jgi:preprotein translocase subunit Sss1
MNDMVLLTRLTGAVLIVIGVVGYALTGGASLTALLPSVLGIPILGLGLWAGDQARRRTALHVALVFALLGFLGTLMNVVQLPAVLSGGEVARPTAVVVSSITALVCAIYLAVGVRSFLSARRSRS